MAKKILKITGIVLGVILILLIILPFVFKGRIVELVKTEINETVDAQVEFGDFRLSLIRNFPNLSVRVDDVRVTGIEKFENDTLANIGRLAITFDIMSLFGEQAYEVKSITINSPDILLKVLADGTANWDIVATDEEAEPQPQQEESGFRLSLQRVEINNGDFVYHDDLLTTYISAYDLDAVMRGDLTQDVTNISTRNTSIGSFSLRYDNMPILSDTEVDLSADIEANIEDFVFTFRENRLTLNRLPLRFDGVIAMPGDDIDLDITFNAPESEFRHFISLIPAIYAKDFEQLSASGTLDLNGFVKGTYKDDILPSFGADLVVNDGMFQYEGMPGSVSNVNIEGHISNPGGAADLTEVNVPVFEMDMAGNPFSASLNLRNPVSDPFVDAMVKGVIDLGNIQTFYPLGEDVVLSGIIETDLSARGRLSSIEKERYGEFNASGQLSVKDVEYKDADFPQGIQLTTAMFRFTPQNMQLNDFKAMIGESDIQASGRIDNVLGYLFDDQLLRGRFSTSSGYFNLNLLMEGDQEPREDEPTELSVIEVPENIDFILNSNFERLVYGDIEITDVDGRIRIVNQEAILENLVMNLLGGKLILNGTYNTREELPQVDFSMDVRQFDIQETFKQFNTVQILAPIGEYAAGSISGNLNLNTMLSDSLMPVLSTISGGGSLRSNSVGINNAPGMNKLANQLNIDMFRDFNVPNLNLSFKVNDGRVDVEPFDVQLGQVNATISGSNFFDQRIDYNLDIEMPRQLFGESANRALEDLIGQAAQKGIKISPSETVNLDVVISGSFSDPQISLGVSEMADRVRDQLKEEADRLLKETEERISDEIETAKDKVKKEVEIKAEEVSDDLQQELEARAEKVMKEARIQADRIIEEADKAAEKIREEARQQAARLEEEASGPLAKAAAQRAGQALISEADKKADNLQEEAKTNAEKILEEARQQADRIRAGEI